MAKKFVRGITDVKTINNQDFDTNNVNDLLSDGQYNYIHRKKGKNEEYHNLTDNIKTLSSDNTDLLTVTNNNKTTNTATLSPKHDNQKEQVLESTRNTISIQHGTNGTDEKTTVDVNFDKVQAKLTAGDGLSIDNNRINIKPTSNGNPSNNGFYMGNLKDDIIASSIISLQSESNRIVQFAFRESAVTPNLIVMKYRFVKDGSPTEWKDTTIDNEQLLSLLAQKQNTLTSNVSIAVGSDNTLRQLFYYKKTYSQAGGTLKTYIKQLFQNTSISEAKNEYNFLLKINQGESSLTFTLESTDSFFFSLILGSSNTANISGCVFTKSDTTLTVSTTNNTDKDYIITFSELID